MPTEYSRISQLWSAVDNLTAASAMSLVEGIRAARLAVTAAPCTA